MPQPSTSDVQVLLTVYTTFANDIEAYQSEHATDPDVDQDTLVTLVSDITQHARTLADDAVATTFNNVANDLTKLQTLVTSANTEINALKQQAGKYTQIAAIASGVLGIAAALASHNFGSVMQSAQTLTQTLSTTVTAG